MIRPRRRSLLRHAVGYGLPVLVAAAATTTWFSPGRFFAAGDVPPYLRTNAATELTGGWSHQITGAGSVSYAILQAPDVALLAVTGAFGGTAPAAQHVLYLLCAGYAAFGAAYLAGAWVSHPLARAAAGLLGAFNLFLVASYPNPLPAVAIGLTGVLAGLVLRAARGRRVPPLLLAVASLPLCYLAPNPSMLVVVAAGVAGAAGAGVLLAGAGSGRRTGALLVRALAWAVPLNLWWLVPYGLALSGGGGANVSAQTDVLAWSWSHARASLTNVVTLNGQWGWTDPDLYPYAPAMGSGTGPVLRWILPALALAAPCCADRARRRAAWLLAGALVPVVVLSTGTHPPLGGLNLWLYQHVPGAWLFRDPTGKLGVFLVLGYTALAALTVARLLDLAARPVTAAPGPRAVVAGRAALGVAAVAVLAAVAYPVPLWTGAVAPTHSGLLPGARVAVPPDWYRLAGVLDADPDQGKVLILPLDPYYQVETAWGYYGVDEVPAQLFRRPVLRQLPGGYFSASDGVAALLGGVQRNLLDGDAAAAAAQLRALGVSHLVVRRDLRGSAYAAAPADPARIAATVRRLAGVTVLVDTPVGALFRLGGGGTLRVASGVTRVGDTDAVGLADAVGRTGAVLSGTGGPAATGVDWQTYAPAASTTVTVDQAGAYAVSRPPEGPARYRAAVTVHPGGTPPATLDLADAQAMTLAGVPLPPRPPLSVPLSRTDPVTLVSSAEPTPVDPHGGVVTVGTRTTLTVYRSDGRPNLLGSLVVAACLPAAAAVPAVSCRAAPVLSTPAGAIRVHFAYRSGGDAGGVCLWQAGPDRCASLPPLLPGPDWREYVAVVTPDRGTTALRLQISSGVSPASPAVAYRDIAVDGLRRIGRAVLTAAPPPTVSRILAAGGQPVVLRGPAAGDVAAAGLIGCGAADAAPASADAVDMATPAGGSRCVRTGPASPSTGRYLVAFRFRADPGTSARACVWQDGPDNCADMAALPGGSGWYTFTGTVSAAPGTRAVTLYLYADGSGGRAGTVSYRDVRFAPAVGTELLLTGTAAGTAPALDPRQASPDHFLANVRGAHGPFVLALAESYAPGWHLTGLPAGWTAVHFEVDGYANGWLVTGTGDAALGIGYQPDLMARAALWISLLAAVLALLWLAGRRLSTRRRAAAPPVPPLRPPAQRTTGPVSAPLVSVIVPTRDSAELMRRFLDSCRASTYRNLEVVVNDDVRSTDDLAAVATEFTAAGLRVCYLAQNLSMAQGRAVGAWHSHGDILMHLDADMELAPDLVAECVELIGAGADALVVPEESFGTTFWADCKWLEKRCYEGVSRIESLRVLTRACYDAVGGHDPRLVFSEDKDLDLRVRAAGYRVGRTAGQLRHNEGHLTLRGTLAKKRRYARTAGLFAELHPEQFAWQANVLHRYAIFLRRIDQLFVHPLRYLGLLFLKTAECAAAATGLVGPRRSGRTPAPLADVAREPDTSDRPTRSRS